MAKETLKNNNTIEIVGKNGITFLSKTINPGFTNERKQFSFSGRVRKNKPTLIGELTVTAAENKLFKKNPGLKPFSQGDNAGLGSNLKMVLKSVEEDSNGNKTAYVYNLMYTGKENVQKTNKLSYSLSNETKSIKTKAKGVHRVDFGPLTMSEKGDSRVITVHGDVGSRFNLAIIKLEDSKPSDDAIAKGYVKGQVLNTTQTSITNTDNANSTYDSGSGIAPVDIIDNYIKDSSGKFSFVQEFPKSKKYTRYAINVLSTYAIGNWSRSGWNKNLNGWSNWYSKIINQYINPRLTLRATKTLTTYKINEGSLSDTSYDYVFNGTYDSIDGRPEFKITYNFVSDGRALAIASGSSPDDLSGTKGNPVFSRTLSTASDWTNSIPSENGGTSVEIWGTSTVIGTPTSTATLTFYCKIRKWGTENVVMSLDLDDVINNA